MPLLTFVLSQLPPLAPPLHVLQATNFKAPGCAAGGVLQCALTGYEVVASRDFGIGFSSGGGFSDIAVRPKFQDDAVAPYLQNSTAVPAAANFNASGRAAPDVSFRDIKLWLFLV